MRKPSEVPAAAASAAAAVAAASTITNHSGTVYVRSAQVADAVVTCVFWHLLSLYSTEGRASS